MEEFDADFIMNNPHIFQLNQSGHSSIVQPEKLCINKTNNNYFKIIKQGLINENRRGKLKDIDRLNF